MGQVWFVSAASLRGDLNYDGRVDTLDLGALNSRWGSADSDADLDGSGGVDAGDMQILLSLFTSSAPAAGPSPPVLDSLEASTTRNPYGVAGGATPGIVVRLYINAIAVDEVVAGADGRFMFNALLVDGLNYVHARSDDGVTESVPSATRVIEYVNSTPRTQSGILSGDHTWTPGLVPEPYLINGDLTVAAGASLLLAPGTELRFAPGTSLRVEGSLSVVGRVLNPVIFTSDKLAPAAGDWNGIVVPAGGTLRVDSALIEWAYRGVDADGAQINVSNSTIRNFGMDWYAAGVYMQNGAGGLIAGNLLEHDFVTQGSGLFLTDSSPEVRGNLIRKAMNGLRLELASNPLIHGGNEITENRYGVYAWDRFEFNQVLPNPIINGNAIHNNSDHDFWFDGYADQSAPQLDASGNWWGSAQPGVFMQKIYPGFRYAIRLAPFLDGLGGAPVAGEFLGGRYVADAVLNLPSPAIVLGNIIIDGGARLTLMPGTQLQFAPNSAVSVSGNLNAAGLDSNPVTLSSTVSQGVPDTWFGIRVIDNGAVTLSRALLEYAGTGIDVYGGRATVNQSELRSIPGSALVYRCGGVGAATGNQIHDMGRYAISTYCGDGVTILNNHIENTDAGIYIGNGAPVVQGNRIQASGNAIEIHGASNVRVDGGNIIENNLIGIYVRRGHSQARNPEPVVTGNILRNNSQYNYYAENFKEPYELVLDASRNWWGGTNAQAIADSLSQASLSAPAIGFTPFLDSENGVPVNADVLAGVLPADTTLGADQLHEVYRGLTVPSGVTLTLEAGAELRFSPGAGLIVQGSLRSLGTSNAPVLLTSDALVPQRGDWAGVILTGAPSLIRHTEIAYAERALEAAGADVVLENSLIREFSSYGVYMRYRDTASVRLSAGGEIRGNRFIDSSGWGIRTELASPAISDNLIEGLGTGIDLNYRNSSAVSGNTIRGNNTGIQLTSGFVYNRNDNVYGKYYDPSPAISNNALTANSNANLVTSRYYANPGASVDARNNWWGTNDSAQIAAGIIDELDRDPNYPIVVYEPFLSVTPLLAPILDGGAEFTNQNPYPLGGRAEAGLDVNVYVNGGLAATVTADPDGRFLANVVLTEGANAITARTARGTDLSGNSSVTELTLDTVPPVVTVTAPAPGSATNVRAPEIQGNVNEPVVLSANGMDLATDAGNGFIYSATLSEGPNTITFQALDRAGNLSEHAYQIELDVTPPQVLDPGAIGFGELSAAQVVISGAPGSVEAGVIVAVVNERTGVEVRTVAAPDGGFTLSIAAQPGDSLAVLLLDLLGNSSERIGHKVNGVAPALALYIDSPSTDATVGRENLSVLGRLEGPANTGVVVNGVTAMIYDGRWLARIPLVPGLNPITAKASTIDGTQVTQSVNVTLVPGEADLAEIDTAQGKTPLDVKFTVTGKFAGDIAYIEIDTDGDGFYDVPSGTPDYTYGPPDINGIPEVTGAEYVHTYTEGGMYTARLRIVDVDAIPSYYDFEIAVESGRALLNNGRSLFTEMRSRLKSGDTPGALNAFADSARERYQGVFDKLGTQLPSAVNKLGQVVGSRFSDELGELIVVQETPDGPRTFLVYLIRGEDGVWRIMGM